MGGTGGAVSESRPGWPVAPMDAEHRRMMGTTPMEDMPRRASREGA